MNQQSKEKAENVEQQERDDNKRTNGSGNPIREDSGRKTQ
jgi:hypothetical protein